jgi:hypothetical protein
MGVLSGCQYAQSWFNQKRTINMPLPMNAKVRDRPRAPAANRGRVRLRDRWRIDRNPPHHRPSPIATKIPLILPNPASSAFQKNRLPHTSPVPTIPTRNKKNKTPTVGYTKKNRMIRPPIHTQATMVSPVIRGLRRTALRRPQQPQHSPLRQDLRQHLRLSPVRREEHV